MEVIIGIQSMVSGCSYDKEGREERKERVQALIKLQRTACNCKLKLKLRPDFYWIKIRVGVLLTRLNLSNLD